jgi:hypothetical protein
MKISEILARDAEDAWIEKYRKALDTIPTVPERKPGLGEVLVRMSKNVTTNSRRLRDWLQKLAVPNPRLKVQVGQPAVVRTATAASRSSATMTRDTGRARMVS